LPTADNQRVFSQGIFLAAPSIYFGCPAYAGSFPRSNGFFLCRIDPARFGATHGFQVEFDFNLTASVMAQLGHTDPKFTLRVYTHMMRRGPAERAQLKALVDGDPVELSDLATSEREAR
jgi:hypothetical protein